MTPKTCRRCNGEGRLKGTSYAGGVCARCGGTGVAPEPRTAAQRDYDDLVRWATEEGHRRERGSRRDYAAHAVRHLAKTDPARFAKAVASFRAGRADLYAALVALADEAASR